MSLQTVKPPGPKHFFGLDFINSFKNAPLPFLMDLHQKYGDTVFARMGPYKAFFFFHPDAIKEALVKKVKQLPKFRVQVKILGQWNGNGLLLSEGEFWSRQHRLVQGAFQTKRFEGYVSSIAEKTLFLRRTWEELKPGTSLDVEEAMTGLTLNIIAKTLFGAELTEGTAALAKAVADLSEIAVKEMGQVVHYPDWVPLKDVKRRVKATKYLHATLERLIADRRKTGKDLGDLLSMLLQAVDSDDSKSKMTDEQARDEAMVLFMAGHDTTASGLTWLLYTLARYPEFQKRAFEEIKEVLQGRTSTFADTQKLPYLTAFIKETLRLYPPAIGVFARETTEDILIGDVAVPRKSIVYIFSYVTHRDARWFPNPETFEPARFLPENEKNISPFAYFPFGVGPRACIGAQFAMTEMLVVLALLLQKFEFQLPDDHKTPEPLALMSLRPKGGLKIRLAKRH